MFKYWKYWLSAIVIVLLHVFSEGVPVDGVVNYGASTAAAGAALANAGRGLTGLADLLITAIPGPKERKLRKRLEERAFKESTGLSKAQRAGLTTEALRGIRGQEASVEKDLRRQAAAAGGFGKSGRVQQTMGQQGQARKEFMAQVGADIQKASQAKLQAEEAARIAAEQQLAADIAGRKAAVTQSVGRLAGTVADTAGDISEVKLARQQADFQRQLAEFQNPGFTYQPK